MRYFSLILCFLSLSVYSQRVELPVDTMVITNHSVNIRGNNINYTAQTGTQPVWNELGEPVASLFYTYYKRSDVKKQRISEKYRIRIGFLLGLQCYQ